MKVIVGLGNPGRQYERTRHNAGFMVVERLCDRHARSEPVRARFNGAAVEAVIAGERCLLLRPTAFMNRSGQSVADAVNFYKADRAADLLVVTDDLALDLGSLRLRPSGSDGGHNGLADVQRALGTDVYPRLRFGIGARPPFMDQADYVLSRFTDDEMAVVTPAVARAGEAVELFISRGLDSAMNTFNARPRPAPPERPRDGARESTTEPRAGGDASAPPPPPTSP